MMDVNASDVGLTDANFSASFPDLTNTDADIGLGEYDAVVANATTYAISPFTDLNPTI